MARNCSICGKETSTADGYCTRTDKCRAARLRKPEAKTATDWYSGSLPPETEDVVSETMEWIEQIARENSSVEYRKIMQRLAEECDLRGHRGMQHKRVNMKTEELEKA